MAKEIPAIEIKGDQGGQQRTIDDPPPRACGEDAEKGGNKAEGPNMVKQFAFGRRILVTPTQTRGRKEANLAIVRKE